MNEASGWIAFGKKAGTEKMGEDILRMGRISVVQDGVMVQGA